MARAGGLSDCYAINTCICFRLALSGGSYRQVGDTTTELFWANSIGPVSKWVNDHLFFWIQWEYLAESNQNRKRWRTKILQNGGEHCKKGRLWFQGIPMPNGISNKFDKNMSFQFKVLATQLPTVWITLTQWQPYSAPHGSIWKTRTSPGSLSTSVSNGIWTRTQ